MDMNDCLSWIIPVVTILGMFIANAALFLPMFFWNRSEANADRRDMMKMLQEMKDEMKDFHGRLCAIEERNRPKTDP